MKHTKGKWEQRKLFEFPILVQDKEGNREWFSNTISIHSEDGRIICDVLYQSDTMGQGWGRINNTPEWEANAKLIAAAPEMLQALILMDKHNSIPPEKWDRTTFDGCQLVKEIIKKATT